MNSTELVTKLDSIIALFWMHDDDQRIEPEDIIDEVEALIQLYRIQKRDQ